MGLLLLFIDAAAGVTKEYHAVSRARMTTTRTFRIEQDLYVPAAPHKHETRQPADGGQYRHAGADHERRLLPGRDGRRNQERLWAIETVKIGQWVACRNEAGGKTTWRRVVQTFRTEDMQALAVDVRYAGGEIERIQTTTEHPFYVQDKQWCEARELDAGDRLVLIDSTLSTVVAVESMPGLHVLYNFEVELQLRR